MNVAVVPPSISESFQPVKGVVYRLCWDAAEHLFAHYTVADPFFFVCPDEKYPHRQGWYLNNKGQLWLIAYCNFIPAF